MVSVRPEAMLIVPPFKIRSWISASEFDMAIEAVLDGTDALDVAVGTVPVAQLSSLNQSVSTDGVFQEFKYMCAIRRATRVSVPLNVPTK